MLIEKDEEDQYVATVPALRGCHTQAKSLDTLIKRTREVIELCLEDEGDQSGPLELVGIQQISGMTRLPRIRGKEFIRILEKIGFRVVRTRGSHVFLRHVDGRVTTVPVPCCRGARPRSVALYP